jgi:hypothetical protein
MFTTQWNGSFPEETDAETRESEILVLQKATIDPHFVPWLKGKDQYNKYMNNGWRMRELGEYVSMTALQKKTMAASLPRGMREYPRRLCYRAIKGSKSSVAWATAWPSPAVSMPPDSLCTVAAWFVGEGPHLLRPLIGLPLRSKGKDWGGGGVG